MKAKVVESRRSHGVARVIRLAIRLSQRGLQSREATPGPHDGAKRKQFYRDIAALEQAVIPVYTDDERRFRVDPHFMKRFL